MTSYDYWRRQRAPIGDYYGPTALRPMLGAWLSLRWFGVWFWLKHRVARRPLPPVPAPGKQVTTTSFDDLIRGMANHVVEGESLPWFQFSRLPLKPKDEP